MDDEDDELVSLLENVWGWDDVSAKDIKERMTNDDIYEVTCSDIVEIVTQGKVVGEWNVWEASLYGRKHLYPHSKVFSFIEVALQ